MGIDKVILAVIALCAILALLLVGAGVCGLCWFTNNVATNGVVSGPVEHREDKTIHAPADKVYIDAGTFGGDVEVSESETGQIEIIYDVYATQGHLYDIVTNTSYATEGDTLVIKSHANIPDYKGQWVGTRGASLHIKLPKNASYSFNLNTAGGNVIVPEFQGDSLEANTAGGDIRVNGGKYDSITVHTAGGKIVADYEAETASFETLGGDVDLTSKQLTGTLKATTMGGDVTVRMAEGTMFSIDASTMGGKVTHGSIPMVTTDEGRSKLVGHTEGSAGSLSIELRTMGGDIEISY